MFKTITKSMTAVSLAPITVTIKAKNKNKRRRIYKGKRV